MEKQLRNTIRLLIKIYSNLKIKFYNLPYKLKCKQLLHNYYDYNI